MISESQIIGIIKKHVYDLPLDVQCDLNLSAIARDIEEAANRPSFTEAITKVPIEPEDYMDRVEQHADPQWKQAAMGVISDLCRMKPKFTSDDVLLALEHIGVQTHDNRALGPLMMKARKEGWCEKTGEMMQSRRKASHKRPQAVWRSRLRSVEGLSVSLPPSQ